MDSGDATCRWPHWPVLRQGADALSGLRFQPARAFHADAVCRWLPGRWQLVLQVIELSSGSQNKIIALLLHTNEECVTQLFRHRRSLFYVCFGFGHCCKETKPNKTKQKTWASGLYWSGKFLPPTSTIPCLFLSIGEA